MDVRAPDAHPVAEVAVSTGPFPDAPARRFPVATAALIVGGAPIVLFTAVVVAGVLGLAVGVRVGAWSLVPAVAAEVVYVWYAWRSVEGSRALPRTVATVAVWLIVIVAAGVVSSRVADTSTDGRHYHSESVLALAHGWNPVRDAPVHWRHTDPDTWTNAYPKGPWIVMATVMRAGGDLESSKLVGIVLLLAAACVAFGSLLLAGLTRTAAAILGGAAALNPVATVQLFTHMVDGITASLTVVAVALTLLWVLGRERRVVTLPVLGAALLMLANTKFTGLVLGVVLVGGVVVLGGLIARLGRRVILRMTAALAACLALAVVVGFNPYVTNTVRHDSPLYPVYGPHSIDVEAGATTGSLRHMSSVEQVVATIFSTSSDRLTDPKAKIPFSFAASEWDVFRVGQVRIGGLGPLFGGVMLLALAGAVWIVVARARVRRRRREVWALLIAAGLCLVLALVTRDGYLVRIVPQLWLVPVLVFAALLLAVPARGARALAWVGVALLVVNALGVAGVAMRWAVHDSDVESTSLHTLARMRPVPDVEFGGWERAERRRLDEAGVRYHAVRRVTCPVPVLLRVSGSLRFATNAFVSRPVSGVLICPGTA